MPNYSHIGPTIVDRQETVTALNGRANGSFLVEISQDEESDDEIKSPAVHIKQTNLYCEPTADNTRVNCPHKCGQTFTTNASARRHAKKCDGSPRADIQRGARNHGHTPARPLLVEKRQRICTTSKSGREITPNPLLSGNHLQNGRRITCASRTKTRLV